jgi:hypothetical protein
MLNLKIIWSLTATASLIYSALTDFSWLAVIAIGIFALFGSVWVYYRVFLLSN